MKRPTDKQRLDWLQKKKQHVYCLCDEFGVSIDNGAYKSYSLRAAIDKAMKEDGKK